MPRSTRSQPCCACSCGCPPARTASAGAGWPRQSRTAGCVCKHASMQAYRWVWAGLPMGRPGPGMSSPWLQKLERQWERMGVWYHMCPFASLRTGAPLEGHEEGGTRPLGGKRGHVGMADWGGRLCLCPCDGSCGSAPLWSLARPVASTSPDRTSPFPTGLRSTGRAASS